MRVLLLSPAEDGCAYVRCEQPLRASGVPGEHKLYAKLMVQNWRRRPSEGWRQRVLPVDADVVVFQRPAHMDQPGFIEQFQRQGIAVVVDIDDDLRAIHSQNGAYPLFSGAYPGFHARYASRCCALADLVTVSTPALAERYGAHGRVIVLPNAVPEKILDYPRTSDGRTVGWAGAVASHPGDLEVTYGGVGEALDGDWRFHVIGEAAGVRERLHLPCEPTETPWIARVDDYHRALGCLDIGVAPLADNAFNQGKSALKLLEGLARGVAMVTSPRAEYTAVGGALFAKDRSRSWRAALRRLMDDDSLRVEMAEQGRQLVRDHHLFERRGHLWAEAWEQALASRLSGTRRAA
jgi:glycosyltransferase involved in cell wall biosynthesis